MAQDIKEKIKDYNKLIRLDQSYQIHDQQKKKLATVLQQQVQYLLDKKQKQAETKRRLKLLEQEFEKKRKLKISTFQQKTQNSQKAKSHQIKQKLQKNKKILQHVQKIHKKANQEYNSIVKQGLQKRRQFYAQDSGKTPGKSIKAETQQNFRKSSKQKLQNGSKILHFQTSRQMNKSRVEAEDQMKKIVERLQKAKISQMEKKRQIIKKLQEKDRHHSQIQEKIRSQSMMEQQRYFKQLYGKSEQMMSAEERVRDLTEKHLSDKRKSFQEKMKKLQENIRFIETEKNEKYSSLENKLSKIFEGQGNRGLGNKSSCHRQKVITNNLKLEQQRNRKAEEILKKHSQMTAKNKIFKQKKDQILQAIKKINPELDQ